MNRHSEHNFNTMLKLIATKVVKPQNGEWQKRMFISNLHLRLPCGWVLKNLGEMSTITKLHSEKH